MKSYAINRKAYHDYDILEEYEAGIELKGAEVKSIRGGGVELKGAFALARGKELVVEGLRIAPYGQSRIVEQDPLRTKRLLLHNHEIQRIRGRIQEKGLTLVPLKLYSKGPWLKLTLGLGRGKKLFDKREDIKKRDLEREERRRIKA
jgi:SsrA-binding protein